MRKQKINIIIIITFGRSNYATSSYRLLGLEWLRFHACSISDNSKTKILIYSVLTSSACFKYKNHCIILLLSLQHVNTKTLANHVYIKTVPKREWKLFWSKNTSSSNDCYVNCFSKLSRIQPRALLSLDEYIRFYRYMMMFCYSQ